MKEESWLATIAWRAKDRHARELKQLTEQREQEAKVMAVRKDAKAVSVASTVQASAIKHHHVLDDVKSSADRSARAE